MTTKKYAIPDKVAAVALKYGDTVSKGIQRMEDRLNELKPRSDNNV